MRRVHKADRHENLRGSPPRPTFHEKSVIPSRNSYCGILAAFTAVIVVFFVTKHFSSELPMTPEATFHNFMTRTSQDLSAVSTLIETVNRLEQFRKLEVESISFNFVADAIFDPLLSYNNTSIESEKREGLSNLLKDLGSISHTVGILMNELGREGKGVCNKLYACYSSFLKDLNNTTMDETERSTEIMHRMRVQLIESLKDVLLKWHLLVWKANNQIWNAIQIDKDWDKEMNKQHGFRSLHGTEYTVSKIFGFFHRIIGGRNFDDNTELLRLVPKPITENGMESLIVHIKMMERCRSLLKETQIKVSMLFSVSGALFVQVADRKLQTAKGNLTWNRGDIVERVQQQLWSIEHQIEMSPWAKL